MQYRLITNKMSTLPGTGYLFRQGNKAPVLMGENPPLT